MNIDCFKTTWTGFRQNGKDNANKTCQAGNGNSDLLERFLCTEEDVKPKKDISTKELPQILNTIDFNKVHPIVYFLLKIEWAIFGSLTWNNQTYRIDSPKGEKLRFADFYLLIRRTCQLLHIKKDSIEFFVTNERGSSCECHLHFLIGKQGLQNILVDKIVSTLKYLWKHNLQLTGNSLDTSANSANGGSRGEAKIELFDLKRKVSGVLYVCKREFGSFGIEYPAVYKTSIALAKHISKTNFVLKKAPLWKLKPVKSIKNYFGLALGHLKFAFDLQRDYRLPWIIDIVRPQDRKKDRTRLKSRYPPQTEKKGMLG